MQLIYCPETMSFFIECDCSVANRFGGNDSPNALGNESVHSVSAYGTPAHGEARHFGDIDSLNAAVLAQLPGTASVLVKGSRFMQMERVVQAVIASAPQQQDREAGHAA